MPHSQSIEDVEKFWNSHPLWTGESKFATGSREFFEEHLAVVTNDTFAGQIDPRLFPSHRKDESIVDIGCGIGVWPIEFAKRGYKKITACDLTEQALALASERANLYHANIKFSKQNAEKLSFPSNSFTHVNCLGVIHHTPNTQQCLEEVERILVPGGTAVIAVYYRNAILRAWPFCRTIGKLLSKIGFKLEGRGRESMFGLSEVDEIVRHYDGADNPIGKCYTKSEFLANLPRSLEVKETFLHFFPARSFPFRLPHRLHKLLDKRLGFMIYASIRKLS